MVEIVRPLRVEAISSGVATSHHPGVIQITFRDDHHGPLMIVSEIVKTFSNLT
jgi:hypothetical protein